MSHPESLTTQSFIAKVQALSFEQLRVIALDSNVPYTTLWNVHHGVTKNPRLETVQKVWPHLISAFEHKD